MHLIEIAPAPCNVCGRGNTPDANGDAPKFIDFERDINWNDPLIMCEDCIAKAGGMVGMASEQTLTDLRRELRKKDKELHDVQAEMDSRTRRAKRLGMSFDKATA